MTAKKTNDKKAPAKKAAASWTDDLAGLNALAQSHSFASTGAAFQHTITPANPGTGERLAMIRAKVPASDRGTLVRVPEALKERIQSEVDGAWTSALVVLADAMLDHLAQTGQRLVSENK